MLLLLVAVACDGDAGAGAGTDVTADVSVTDSAGIRITAVSLAALPVEAVDRVLVGIGAEGSSAEQQLYGVQNAFMADGAVVIANAGSSEIRIYRQDGSLVRTLGAEGEGPGEFRSIEWARPYAGDSLAVWDGWLRRLTILPRDGSGAGRTVRLGAADAERTAAQTPSVRRAGSAGSAAGIAVDVWADGSLLGRLGDISVGPGDTTAVRRDTIRYARFGPDGAQQALLARLPDDEHFVWSSGPSRSVGPLPFGRTTAAAAFGAGMVSAANDGLQVTQRSADGTIVGVARVIVEPDPITDADVQAHRAGELDDLPDAFRQSRSAALDATPFPERAPYHGALVTAEGAVWLELYRKPEDERAPEWIVFDAELRPTARVRLPARTRLTAVRGDTLVCVRRDALDVEEVVLLERRPGD
jgi:hypothetical protein